MSIDEIHHVANGPGLLMLAEVQNQADVAKSPTDYWTFDLRLYRGADTLGQTIGKVSTADTRIDAGTPLPVYDGRRTGGFRLQAGDMIGSVTTRTGTPADLSPAKFHLHLSDLPR